MAQNFPSVWIMKNNYFEVKTVTAKCAFAQADDEFAVRGQDFTSNGLFYIQIRVLNNSLNWLFSQCITNYIAGISLYTGSTSL